MPKRKSNKIKYESVERVSRWNLCQQITRLLYASDFSNVDLEKQIEKLENELLSKAK